MGNCEKNFYLLNYCDSCLHIMQEKGEIESLTADDLSLNNGNEGGKYCLSCGQPLPNALIKNAEGGLELLESALSNKNLKVICFTAPSVRVSLGDEFGCPAGENVVGKMVSALKKLGFHAVFDMNTAADFTILEEASEFVSRLKTGKNLPMFTSCCPGWVNFAKKVYPKLLKNLTTCKSPQQMFGALINNIYAPKNNLRSTDIFVVSIVPCLAKKLELKAEGINTSVGLDVDVAITTKEIAKLIKLRGIDFNKLENEKFDSFFGASSGAGAIFGNTGGVMEAVLRTACDSLTKTELNNLDYKMVRGLDGIKRAQIKAGDKTINIAVVTGLKNVGSIISEIEKEPNKYQFIEVMACEGGCVGGGGQPTVYGQDRESVLKARAKGLYDSELKMQVRKAHNNPAVLEIYKKYLGKVGGKKAKELLHRKYD